MVRTKGVNGEEKSTDRKMTGLIHRSPGYDARSRLPLCVVCVWSRRLRVLSVNSIVPSPLQFSTLWARSLLEAGPSFYSCKAEHKLGNHLRGINRAVFVRSAITRLWCIFGKTSASSHIVQEFIPNTAYAVLLLGEGGKGRTDSAPGPTNHTVFRLSHRP